MALHTELSDSAYTLSGDGALSDLDLAAGTGSWQLTASLASGSLGNVLPLATGGNTLAADSSGLVVGSAQLSGRLAKRPSGPQAGAINPLTDLSGTASLELGESAPGHLRVAGVTLDQARVKVVAGGDALRIEQFELRAGQSVVALKPGTVNQISELSSSARPPQVELHLRADPLRFEDFSSLTGVAVTTRGDLKVEADLDGALRSPVARLVVATRGLTVLEEPIPDRDLVVRVQKGLVLVDGRQSLDFCGVHVDLEGSYADGQAHASARGEVYDLNRLRAVLERAATPPPDQVPRHWQQALADDLALVRGDLHGRLSFDAEFDGQPSTPRGHLDLTASGLRAVEQVPPATPRGTPTTIERPLPDTVVTLNVGLPFARSPGRHRPGVVYVSGSMDLDQGLDSRVAVQIAAEGLELRPYRGWSERLAGLDGLATAHLAVSHSLAEPRLDLADLALTNLAFGQAHAERLTATDASWEHGLLHLDKVRVKEGSLEAGASGDLPVAKAAGRGWRLRSDQAVDLSAFVSVDDLAELRPYLGSVGEIAGNGWAELSFKGTYREPEVSGRLALDLPRLQIVDQRQPLPLAAAAPQPPDRSHEVAWLQNVLVRAEVDHSQLRLTQASGELVPPEVDPASVGPEVPDRLARIGTFRLTHSDGSERAAVVQLAHLDAEHLLDNPINARLRASNLTARTRGLAVRGLGLDLVVEPTFDGTVRNVARVATCAGWVNEGWVSLDGSVACRDGDWRNWLKHDYRLTLTTPAIAPLAGRPGGRPQADGRVIYPLKAAWKGVAEGQIDGALTLRSRDGATPPLALAGQLNVTRGLLSDGVLSLAGSDRAQNAVWPAAPQLDITVVAADANHLTLRSLQLDTIWRMRDLKLTGTPQTLAVSGTVDLGAGTLYPSFVKSRIDIDKGQTRGLRIVRNPVTGAFEPYVERIEVFAHTVVRSEGRRGETENYDVALSVEGTVRPGTEQAVDTHFVVHASSSPPMEEDLILEELSLSGEFRRALQSDTIEAFMQKEVAKTAVQAVLNVALEPVLEQVRRAFNLTTLTVEWDLKGNVVTNASQDLVRNLEWALTVTVNDKGQTYQAVRLNYDVGAAVRGRKGQRSRATVTAQIDSLGDYRVTTQYQQAF
jgi:hypothetical protein